MSSQRGGDRVAGMANRTSPCKTSVLNLGKTPRVPGLHVDEQKEAKKRLPAGRDEKHSLPSNIRIMLLLSMAVVPEERRGFRRRFRRASKDDKGKKFDPTSSNVCNVPISWVAKAFQCEPFQLRRAGDMFPESRIESEFLNEFYIMDVVLNRAPSPEATGDTPENDDGVRHGVDPDVVRPFRSYEPDDNLPGKDYCYRALILFLPQCGKFYCHRERRRGDVGVPGTLIAHDMSWLRLQRTETHGGREVAYTFGADSFVNRFLSETKGHGVFYDEGGRTGRRYLDEDHRVLAWRISTGRTNGSQQNRVMYRASQCHDADGPMMAPDLLDGYDFSTCPHDYLAAEYQRRLASSSSAKKDGRHYVGGCLHYRLPASCWIIDPMETHFVDVMVDIDTKVGAMRNRQSVVMIRNVTKIDADDDHLGLLGRITAHNSELRKAEARGYARHKCEDVGTMHAIGTRIPLDREGTPTPYAANGKVPDGLLRGLVVDLATLARRCFPQVYSVIRDMEGDSGLAPVEPMNGVALADDESEQMTSDSEHDDEELRAIDKARENSERFQRVGYTIDLSINLGNASHIDVHDASQCVTAWTEEEPGRGANWFFLLPNVYGTKPDGTKFRGMAVKLGHGVAISWDGRVLRHCTSVCHPDGMENERVSDTKGSRFHNHLYGTFTAAKERIVQAGRMLSAARYFAPSSSAENESGVDCPFGKKTKKKTRRQRRKRSGRGEKVDTMDLADGMKVEVNGGDNMMESVVNLSVVNSSVVNLSVVNSSDVNFTVVDSSVVNSASLLNNEKRKRRESAATTDCTVGEGVLAVDLDVGGRYKIPKKREGFTSGSK